MPRRLYARIYLHFVGVLIVVSVATAMVFATGWRSAFERSATARLARHIAAQVGDRFDDPASRDGFVRHVADELDLQVAVRDMGGNTLTGVDTMPPLDEREWNDVHGGPTVIAGGRFGRPWCAAAPIVDKRTGLMRGVVVVTLTRHFRWPLLLRPLAMVGLVLIVVAIATAPLARRISRPVARLTEATRRFGDGDLAYRVQCVQRRHGDELAELSRAWNDMADRIEGLVKGHKELLANVSHELRSPLARVRMALELLPIDKSGETRRVDMEHDLEELDHLIDDLLTNSRLEAGVPLRVERVAVSTILDGIRDRAARDPRLRERPLAVDTAELGPSPVELEADPALLARALWNLVDNAAKYGAPPITIAARRHDGTVELAVRDEGGGIAAGERDRVFDAFYRADKARTPSTDGKRGGYGLGLTLARRIAEVHHGSIAVGPAHVDGEKESGCVVTLSLPVEKPAAA